MVLILKGKKVAVGPPGSSTQLFSKVMFDAAGISTEVKSILLSYSDMYNALRDRNVDAFILTATPPSPALQELARAVPIKLISFDKKMMDAIIVALGNSYSSGEIEAGTYYGIDEPIPSPIDVNTISCRLDLPEDVAYNFVRATFENLDGIVNVHAGLSTLTLKNALVGMPLPLHVGAIRYYKEVGLIK